MVTATPQKLENENQGPTVPLVAQNGFHIHQQGTQYYSNYVKTFQIQHQKVAAFQDHTAQSFHRQGSA